MGAGFDTVYCALLHDGNNWGKMGTINGDRSNRWKGYNLGIVEMDLLKRGERERFLSFFQDTSLLNVSRSLDTLKITDRKSVV